MIYSNIPLAQSVVSYCEAYNIKHVVISPGSRNAPLTIGFTYNPNFKCYSIVDERCAAFFALGIAQQIQEPVALVCTSGSALLNYYPAISEAYFSHIPLVVLSADRPEDRIGIGDGQTIFQDGVYGKHIVAEANLKSGSSTNEMLFNFNSINDVLIKCRSLMGPVHLNVPFKEPLYGKTEEVIMPKPVLLKETEVQPIDQNQQSRFIDLWQSTSKKMILIGVLNPGDLNDEIIQFLSEDPALIVFTETTSNLVSEEFFSSIDKIIAPLGDEEFKQLQPDLLVTIGGLVVSKKIKAFLREYPAKEHWHIDRLGANNTFFYLTEHVQNNPNDWFYSIASNLKPSLASDYKFNWKKIRAHRNKRHDVYMSQIPFSDLLVFHQILKNTPRFLDIHMSNSSTIRYAQLFNWNHGFRMFCNRGTSGIDGSTSTAIGASVVAQQNSLFITGDLSFFYDSNALWNNYIPKNFKIILINNGGGGIFRILPGHKNTENFNTYFETRHSLTAEHLCVMYRFQYLSASNSDEIEKQLKDLFLITESPALLEVFTPSEINDEILLNYFEFIR